MFGPLGDPHYSGYTVAIHDNGNKLLQIINDILDLTRVEGGLIDLDEETVLVADVIDNACALAQTHSEKAVVIEKQIASFLPFLRAEQKRIRQILNHVISNAVKFTPDGGRIEIRGELNSDGGIVITVGDNGIGMEEDRISIALEPLTQLDTRIARRYEGVGLGLPLANALTRFHGGELTIESTPGVGMPVRIAFPAERTIDSISAACA
jgi:signal transduction histidine kinase